MNYISFVLREKRILSFGVSFTFFSSFGQTFLISLFVPYFLIEFDLSNAAFGSLYSIATLGSAMILPYLGGWIDRLPLKKYSLFVACGLMTASLTVAISWNIIFLFAGLLLLRLSGQGLSGHTAQTAMARYYTKQRGKALSISSLGYPIGEGILPLIIAGMLTFISWRLTWGAIVVVIGVIFIPLIYFMLKTSEIKDEEAPSLDGDENSRSPGMNTYLNIVDSKQFWLLVPAVLLPAFWVTALFLYQVSIAEQLGWTAALIASAFVCFAGARIVSSLSVGPLIDRWSAQTLFPFYLLPFGAGLTIAYFHPGMWSAFLYMALLGTTMGIGSNIRSALWAELYGTDIIGTVRSLFSAMMVFSTAMSPFMVGWMLDNQVSMTSILLAAVITILIGTLMAFAAFRVK